MTVVNYWIFILETAITSLLLVVTILRLGKIKCMNSVIFRICVVCAIINLKFERTHLALIIPELTGNWSI